jgi:hypothetical protein
MRRLAMAVIVAAGATLVGAGPAVACGFLVAPNGAVNLVRTTTLAAYHNGVEHYVTSFQFLGSPKAFGSIIPLPAAPTKVERGGDWTLQRLVREVQRGFPVAVAAATTAEPDSVEVLQRTRVDALDIAVLKGGGADVVDWARRNGFALPLDTVPAIQFYAERSPYFMVARFDAAAAKAKGLHGGDGIPVHLTIPVKAPWVPLRILATAKQPEDLVRADVFLLTDTKPVMLSTRGPQVERSQAASPELLADLRADKGMSWVPERSWLTHLTIDAPAAQITGDLAVDATGLGTPSLRATGLTADTAVRLRVAPHSGGSLRWVLLVALGGVLAAGAVGGYAAQRARTT